MSTKIRISYKQQAPSCKDNRHDGVVFSHEGWSQDAISIFWVTAACSLPLAAFSLIFDA
jgi:hypothetical protein